MRVRSHSSDEHPSGEAQDDAGVTGNERLTALTGAVLLALFAVEIVTVVLLHDLMPVHFLVGVILIGPVAVKTASTGWRFLRYYSGQAAYRRKGPPRMTMRVLSPLLLAATVAVIGSGVALALTGPAPPVLLRIHALSFVVWLILIVLHVVAYVARVPNLILADWRRPEAPAPVASTPVTPAPTPASPVPASARPVSTQVPGRWARLMMNVAALVAAGVAAVALLPAAVPWDGWLEQAVSGPGVFALAVIAVAGVVAAVGRGRRTR